jgi:hypothetical protein
MRAQGNLESAPNFQTAMIPVVKKILQNIRDRALEAMPARAALNLEFLMYHRRFPRLDNPLTFNEKILHRKLFDRDPRLPRFTDKILAKQHVAQVLGPEWTVPTIWHGNALPPGPDRNWPIPYVLKASHGSGWNLFIRSPEQQKWNDMEQTASRWLRGKFGTAAREWAYSMIEPRLLVEPYLGDIATSPTDYKLFVFGGKVVFIQVDTDRERNHRQYFFDKQWKRQPFEYACPGTAQDIRPPKSIDKMIWAAERLGASFPFVRVDLYEIDGTPLFGEMTFYPNSGRIGFRPKSADVQLGQLWPAP